MLAVLVIAHGAMRPPLQVLTKWESDLAKACSPLRQQALEQQLWSAGDMASVVTELEGYIRETQASGGQQVTVLKQVLDVAFVPVRDSPALPCKCNWTHICSLLDVGLDLSCRTVN